MWSEKVFSMVNNGRLESGWGDRYVIKDIQRDVYAIGVHLNENKSEKKPEQTNGNNWYHREINIETDGKPCVLWNRGENCGFNISHGTVPNRCSWCALKFKCLNFHHKEVECNNKKVHGIKKK